jgi:hypothetical protein
MKKVCNYCGKEKEIDSFYKMKSSADAHQKICKLCTNIVTRQYREKRIKDNPPVEKTKEDTKTLSLVGTCKKDYCAMYEAMNKLGYSPSNPEMDIHTQFMNKWSLKVSKSPRKGPANQFTYEDCCK